MQRPERRPGRYQRPQRFLALHAREMEDDVLGAYRLAVMEHQGEPAERVVADGEQENARLADPGGRAVLRAHREGERRGNGFLVPPVEPDRKSTRLNSSHMSISYAVFCLKKKKKSTQEKPVENKEQTTEMLF